MEFYAEIVNNLKPLTIFAKSSILDVWHITDLKINNWIGWQCQKSEADFESTATILVWSPWGSQN